MSSSCVPVREQDKKKALPPQTTAVLVSNKYSSRHVDRK
jgi:hypothetical protein